MNNKLIWLCLGMMTATGVTSGTLFYHAQIEKIQVLSANLEQQKQKIAVLNDQLVVLQRHVSTSATSKLSSTPVATQQENLYLQEDYLKDYVDLIQLNIQQQQFDDAVKHIQQLKQKLETQPLLSDALNKAIIEALTVDQANIHQYVKYRAEHLQLLQTHLTQLEKITQPIALDQAQDKWNFKQWFNLSRSEDIPDLQHRDLIYHHLQLRILLAQQALMAGQLEFYQQQILIIKTQLKQYPDTQSQNIFADLTKIQNLPLNAPLQMTALTLVRGA